jgi:hypothetical protein
MHRHPNPRLVKIHYSYTVGEVARMLKKHKNTVRTWIKKEGLQPIDGRRPTLVHGPELVRFLQTRRKNGKRPCPPGYMYCLKCRTPKQPAAGMVDYLPATDTSGNLRALCPDFDPYSPRYKSTFRECLGIVKALNCRAICEIHYRHHDNKPSPADLEREAANLFRGVIPADMTVTIYCWRQKEGGEDFHDRFLLTDKGGIGIGAGFSAEGDHQTANMHLMSFELSQKKIKTFARTATDYELVEPVLRIAADGHVEHV